MQETKPLTIAVAFLLNDQRYQPMSPLRCVRCPTTGLLYDATDLFFRPFKITAMFKFALNIEFHLYDWHFLGDKQPSEGSFAWPYALHLIIGYQCCQAIVIFEWQDKSLSINGEVLSSPCPQGFDKSNRRLQSTLREITLSSTGYLFNQWCVFSDICITINTKIPTEGQTLIYSI